MNLHPIPMTKPIKVPKVTAPKIASVHIAKVNGGFKVQHNMSHGPKPVPFTFQDPKKMMSHLNRIQSSAWREPDRNDAHAVTHALDLGPTS